MFAAKKIYFVNCWETNDVEEVQALKYLELDPHTQKLHGVAVILNDLIILKGLKIVKVNPPIRKFPKRNAIH